MPYAYFSTTVLAALVTPGLFYAGAAAMSVPIIIHLLARRRFRRIRWAAIDFLVQAEKHRRRKFNLQQLLLLALRCLAVGVLGLLLARPFVKPERLTGLLSARSAWRHVFVLDDSYSMAYTSGPASTFDRAKSDLLQLLDWRRSEAAADPYVIFTTSEPQPVLAGDTSEDLDSWQATRSRIEALQPSHQAARFNARLQAINSSLLQDSEPLNAAVYVLSDFQKKDWLVTLGEDGSSARSPLQTFDAWPESRDLEVLLLQCAREPRPNLAITDLSSRQPQVVATIENRFAATIANFSDQPSAPSELDVYLGEAAQTATAVAAIPRGGTTAVSFGVTFPRDGPQDVHVELPADGLNLDNHRLNAHEVQPAIRVLVFNGEPSTRTIEDETALLSAALRPEGQVYSGFDAATLDEGQLEHTDLSDLHVVILANIYRISEAAVSRLERYVSGGGGLVIFLGDQVDPDLYNTRLWKEGRGLLPAELLGRIRTTPAQAPPTVRTTDAVHPLGRLFSEQDNLLASGLSFWEYFACQPDPGGDDRTAAPRVVAHFEDAARHPAIIERPFGQGRVLLVTTSADLEWNNWGKWPSYVVFLQELGQHAARASRAATRVLAGDRAMVTLEPGAYQRQAVVRPPGYPADPEIPITLATESDREVVVFPTPRAGVYQVLLTTAGGMPEVVHIAANLDPAESDLDSAAENELYNSAAEIEFRYVTDVAQLIDRPQEGRRELWPALLIAAITILMVEQTLACWFGRAT